MKSRSSLGWILAAALVAMTTAVVLPSCGGDDDDLLAVLSGAEEVPPVATVGSGIGTFEVSDDRSQIKFQLVVFDLQDVLFAHIHVGPPGVNGPIIFNLATAPFTEVSGVLTAADLAPAPAMGISTFADAVAAIEAGGTYANVHTLAFPGGEVRGQIVQD